MINTLLHWRVKTSDAKSIRWEWDGTPHHALGGGEFKPEKLGPTLTGSDNDRTMVRIAWMNLILHELPYPQVFQRDALSKSNPDPGGYDFILANPPFTGTVDKSDFHPRFEHGDESTTKSELLFLWLILAQLRTGGRAAVIVPDGVLFGSTKAHQLLRRELLLENELQAVISLPGGVFLPYAGVKTSILVFQKVGETGPKGEPRTDEVFFYEIEDEARTLNQKRDPRPGQNNDLWDASVKFRAWHQCLTGQGASKKREEARNQATSKGYFQPTYWRERWRFVDETFRRLYPEAANRVIADTAWPLNDLFLGCPRNPDEAEQKVIKQETLRLQRLLTARALESLADLKKTPKDRFPAEPVAHLQKTFDGLARRLQLQLTRRTATDQDWLDRDSQGGQFGLNALRRAFDVVAAEIREQLPAWLKKAPPAPKGAGDEIEIQSLLRSFGQLDGFDVWCQDRDFQDRSPRKVKEIELSPEVKVRSWVVKVRNWARFDDWGTEGVKGEPTKQPTHNEKGMVRADYVADLRKRGAFDDRTGEVTGKFRDRLEPGCIEETGFNLSAGRYKPFDLTPGTHRPPKVILGDLKKLHEKLGGKLEHLLDLVEDRK